MSEEDGAYVVEEVNITDSENDDFEYQSVAIDSLDIPEGDDDYEAMVQAVKGRVEGPKTPVEIVESKFTMRHESTDDFVRNFLVRLGMTKTLEAFQSEWYELKAKGKLKNEDIAPVPDVYLKNQELRDQVSSMRNELEKAQYNAEKAIATWDKLRKEKDFHRMHHHRVQQEKQKIIGDIDKLRKGQELHEAKYKELATKYESVMKEKMLMKLERDRLKGRVDTLERSLSQTHQESVPQDTKKSVMEKTKSKKEETPWPADNRINPYAAATGIEPAHAESFMLTRTYKGHQLAISGLALHARKPILATASDDHTWKMWSLTNGELIMSGEGHTDWVSGVSFHPKGSILATSSGDQTVKLWDFVNAKCTSTFTQHTQAVWNVDFHDSGDFIASCSMDHSIRLWDLPTQKFRQSYRGHVDSVNHCKFQPYSNFLGSASGDKTVSIWDMRTAQCVQTYYGHLNCVNHIAFNMRGDTISSCDSDGVVKIWDSRMVREKTQFDTGQLPANASIFDKSGVILIVASEDANIYVYNLETGENVHVIRGHEQGVQDLVFDPTGKFIVSASSDATFRVWQ